MNRKIWVYITICTGLLMLSSGCEKDEQDKIPDNNFLNALIELGIDSNGDGQISNAEAGVITSLDVSEDSISDLTGIELFVNLDSLDCSKNQLTTLDVSNNTALYDLDCGRNQLITLDVSNNTALEALNCYWNKLTTLHISYNFSFMVITKIKRMTFIKNPSVVTA